MEFKINAVIHRGNDYEIHCVLSKTRERNILSRKSVPLIPKPYDYFYTTFKNEAAQ